LPRSWASRASGWLGARQINGEALIGEGRGARINVEAARRQLDSRLSLSQRLGANGKAKLDGAGSDPADAAIKAERLLQLRHSNARAADEAAARSGKYVEADAVRQEMGAIAGRLVASLEGGLPGIADAVAARFELPPRDVLHVLRTAWGAPCAGTWGVGGGSVTVLADPRALADQAIANALRPSPPVDYLQWATDNVTFAQGEPFPGPYNRANFPYFDAILQALSPEDPCRYVTFVGSAQVGKTVWAIFLLSVASLWAEAQR